jgi:putative DNA primase/helicase
MEERVTQARDSIRAALAFIPAHDRDLWVRMGMAIKSALGEDGFGLWSQWSQQDDSYNERDARNTWRSLKGNGQITIATLYRAAQQRGFRFNGQERSQPQTPEETAARERQRQADEAEKQRRYAEAVYSSAFFGHEVK